MFKFFECQKNFAWVNYAGTVMSVDNSITSVYNNGRFESVQYYYDANYSTYAFTLPRGQAVSNLANGASNILPKYNDTLSSAKFNSASTTCV
ncbi:hypothetical protein SAMN04487781_0710 [Cellulosimicrobium cellulans]|nr:hypothetical protein SAMN04487781_0710 [Cellulosimicrobium cellulans]